MTLTNADRAEILRARKLTPPESCNSIGLRIGCSREAVRLYAQSQGLDTSVHPRGSKECDRPGCHGTGAKFCGTCLKTARRNGCAPEELPSIGKRGRKIFPSNIALDTQG